MKKWFAGLLIVIALAIVSCYWLIPSPIVVSQIAFTHASVSSISRTISDKDNWEKWWRSADGSVHKNSTPYTYKRTHFQLNGKSSNVVNIFMEDDSLKINSFISILQINADSSGIQWLFSFPASINPVIRYLQYRKAVELKSNMTGVLKNLQLFFSNPENIYGGPIYRRSTTDTLLLAAKYISRTYPSTSEIYRFLQPVEQSIQKQHAHRKGFPMVNVTVLSDTSFQTQVAIPTDRKLQGDGNVFFRRMVPGNFMVIEIKGGEYAVREGEKNLEYFISDYGKTKMAIPFQSFVTDRISEPDTTKWLTNIYIPVVR